MIGGESDFVTLDARNTRVTFVASLGPLPVRGEFRAVSGTLALPAADIERARIAIDVVTDSVHTGLAMRDRHLRAESFLHSAHAPLISFRSERVIRDGAMLNVAGTLSLRGVARPMQVRLPVAWGDQRGVAGALSLCCELSISRRDFGVGLPRGLDVLNPIFLAVGDLVNVRIEVTVPATRMLPALLPALGR